jgi:hypothetical protein
VTLDLSQQLLWGFKGGGHASVRECVRGGWGWRADCHLVDFVIREEGSHVALDLSQQLLWGFKRGVEGVHVS